MIIKKVIRLSSGFKVNDQFFIPEDTENNDYKDILTWVNNGGAIVDEFTPAQQLDQAKNKKIQEIKAVRDAKNIEPITDTQAEIINEDSGESMGANSYFVFYTNRHPTNPAADPTALLTNAIVLNQTVPYSSRNLNGNKVTVAITPSIARSLAAHLALRNNNNYKLADAVVKAINDAATEDAVNAITWSVDYL